MKKKIYGFRNGFIALCALMGMAQMSSAQVGVGITSPDPSAQLQIESTNKGLLIPRVTSTSVVSLPATGLMVYQTGGTPGFYYNSGTSLVPIWLRVADAASVSSSPTGAAGGDLTGTYPNPTVANNAITGAKLLDGTVANADIAANAITTSKVVDGTVTTSKMADSAISGLKILSNAVNNAHVANGTLLPGKLSAAGATTGQALVYNGTAIGWSTLSTSPTGAAGGDLTGTYPNPTVANSSITSAKILDGTVTNNDISTSASIAYSKLNLSGSISNTDIADAAITPDKLSTTGATSGQVLGYNGTAVAWTTPAAGGSASGYSFSAATSVSAVSSSTDLSGWTTINPFFSGPGFNSTTGEYTVQATGNYSISATVNYRTTAAVSISQGSGVEPYFEIVKTAPVGTSLIRGYLPVFDVNVALVLTLRTILGSAAVPLNGIVKLTAGDVIKLRYNPNGLSIALNIGGGLNPGVVWSVVKVPDSIID